MNELFIFLTFILLLFVLYTVRRTRSRLKEFERDVRNELRFIRREIVPQTKPGPKPDSPVEEIEETKPDRWEEAVRLAESKRKKPEHSSPPPLPADAAARVSIGASSSPEEKIPAVTAAPRVPSNFESTAREALGKIWSWIVVGEEHRDESVTKEFAIVTTWGIRIGIPLVVIGIGFGESGRAVHVYPDTRNRGFLYFMEKGVASTALPKFRCDLLSVLWGLQKLFHS